jgi:tetratricopeptide (TPR) repeat protein
LLRFAISVLFSTAILFQENCQAQQTAPANGATPAQAGNSTTSPSPISNEVAAAEAAIGNSDWKTAESKLDPWLVSHPTDARALFDAGYVADAENRLDDAAALYRRTIAVDPNSFEAHLSLGLLLARQGKNSEARPELAEATHLDPSPADPVLKARAWRALARIDGDNDPALASSELLEALKLSPETETDTLLAARLAEKAGQLDAAEAAYRRALAEEEKNEAKSDAGSGGKSSKDALEADEGLAHILIVKKQYADAEELLRPALAQAPDDPTLTAQLATVLAAEDKAEALPLLQKLHAAHPADSAITRMLAAVLADAGDYAGADQLDQRLLAAAPDDAGLLVAHGQNLVHQGQLAEAYAAFDKASRIDQASADAWSGLAFTASRTGRPDVTLHALTMRSQYAPENASTLFLWATAYDSVHQKVQAAAYYHRFLDAAGGKFPDQEWQARQRLQVLGK